MLLHLVKIISSVCCLRIPVGPILVCHQVLLKRPKPSEGGDHQVRIKPNQTKPNQTKPSEGGDHQVRIIAIITKCRLLNRAQDLPFIRHTFPGVTITEWEQEMANCCLPLLLSYSVTLFHCYSVTLLPLLPLFIPHICLFFYTGKNFGQKILHRRTR